MHALWCGWRAGLSHWWGRSEKCWKNWNYVQHIRYLYVIFLKVQLYGLLSCLTTYFLKIN